MHRLFALGIVLAAALAGHTANSTATTECHPTSTMTIHRGNLDGDSAPETVTSTNVTCDHDYSLSIVDECQHVRKSHSLRGIGRRGRSEILEANHRNDGRELLYVLSREDAHAPDIGTAGLVHLRRLRSGGCPTPRFLFVYRGDDPLMPPPPGFDLTAFDVSVVQLTTRFRGSEIRLRETFARGQTEMRRMTLLRYSAPADRYVVYRPSL
jgi:hypothetical protein